MRTGPGAALGRGRPLPPFPAGPDAPGRIIVKRGEYGWLDLSDWRDLLTAHVLSLPGGVFIDVDESLNRVRVGIEQGSAATLRPLIDQQLTELGIPRGALLVYETGSIKSIVKARAVDRGAWLRKFTARPLTLDAGPPYDVCQPIDNVANTIRGVQRPVIGGTMICRLSAQADSLYECTIGYLAQKPGETALRFVTASHCSAQQGVVDSSVFYQPVILPSDSVAFEVEDPIFTTLKPGCPEDHHIACRASDALLTSPIAFPGSLGEIARTSMYDEPQWYVINEADGGIYSRFIIAGTLAPGGEQMYDFLQSMGSASGMSYGWIVQMCVNGRMNDHLLLCQDVVDGWAEEGDSGGPIFNWTGTPTEASVQLSGIMDAVTPDPLGQLCYAQCVWFTPSFQIDSDFPGLVSLHP